MDFIDNIYLHYFLYAVFCVVVFIVVIVRIDVNRRWGIRKPRYHYNCLTCRLPDRYGGNDTLE